MLKLRLTIGYLLGIALSAWVRMLFSMVTPKLKHAQVGNIKFYGTIEFMEEGLKAVNEMLPRYDRVLAEQFQNGSASLTFFYSETRKVICPPAGVYVIPPEVWGQGVEGICQFIVYAHILSQFTGQGSWASVRSAGNRDKAGKTPRQRMLAWLENVNYPEKWIACYQSTKAAKATDS